MSRADDAVVGDNAHLPAVKPCFYEKVIKVKADVTAPQIRLFKTRKNNPQGEEPRSIPNQFKIAAEGCMKTSAKKLYTRSE
jgi:hypothetical protein